MIDSPFEQWRLKCMKGIAASSEIMELLALAFEGGRVAERDSCVKIALRYEPIERHPNVTYAADEMRARGNHDTER